MNAICVKYQVITYNVARPHLSCWSGRRARRLLNTNPHYLQALSVQSYHNICRCLRLQIPEDPEKTAYILNFELNIFLYKYLHCSPCTVSSRPRVRMVPKFVTALLLEMSLTATVFKYEDAWIQTYGKVKLARFTRDFKSPLYSSHCFHTSHCLQHYYSGI